MFASEPKNVPNERNAKQGLVRLPHLGRWYLKGKTWIAAVRLLADAGGVACPFGRPENGPAGVK